jgi:exodeoxyribonuclease V gamma subunit
MALSIYRSNRLDVLVAVLAELLRQPDLNPTDPFLPLRVVVGNRGMESWLRHRLAMHLGICAHIAFPFPRQLIDELISVAEGRNAGDAPAPEAWRPGALTWRMLQALQDLPEPLQDDIWAPVRAYLQGGDGPVDARRYALAAMLGDLTDRYVTYRPDLARAWSAGQPAPVRDLPYRAGTAGSRALPRSLAWQPALWQRLVSVMDDAPHMADRLLHARTVFEAGPQPAIDQPIRLFGLSTLPPEWLGFLASVSRHHRVEIFLVCPSDKWWGDLQARRAQAPALREMDRDRVSEALLPADSDTQDLINPLLLSLGRVARDTQIVMESLDDSYVDQDLGLFVPPDQAFQDPASAPACSALRRLQSDILHLTHRTQPDAVPLDPADDSVQIHRCYGPTRQVEGLRETLLGLLETHRDLEARDIVVMTPDIASYAPIISAVFEQGPRERLVRNGEPVQGAEGWGPAGAPRIPYRIADLSVRRLNPVADALMRVLELSASRITASAVLDLAGLEPVRDRFSLTPDELERLGELIHASGARWGLDALNRQEHDQPADRQNTWIDAMDRLWLGVAMPDSGGLYQGMVPVDGIEGDNVDLVGRFGDLVAVVLGAVRDLATPRTVKAWVADLGTLIGDLTATPGPASWLTRRAFEALEGLEEDADGVALPVSVQAITAALANRFDVAAAGLKPQSGAVTFCALTPMRSLPYRVVCLIGMDEGAFPGKSNRAAFDLTQLAPRVGDRDRRDEDRLLFLEALLSAQDHLLIFYSGRDVRTDEVLPPCAPVAELLDALETTFHTDRNAGSVVASLTVSHPLQPFSTRTFRPPSNGVYWHHRPYSFDRRLALGARVESQAQIDDFWRAGPQTSDSPEVLLTLTELADFLDHPIRYFFRQAMGLSLWDGVITSEDREPMQAPERLVSARLLQAALDAPDDESVSLRLDAAVARLRGEAVLPLGSAG